MKDTEIAKKLFDDSSITTESFKRVEARYSSPLFSLNFELKTILYCGVLLLSSGLGVLIYKNIDTIGHLAIILFIAAVSLGCFAYCIKKRVPYSNNKVESQGLGYDYILLFGCLTFVTFVGYLQYQYSVFGDHNDWALLIPAIVFFAAAYRFDHLGVLSLAITTFAGYIGIAITPLELLKNNEFSGYSIIYSGLALGLLYIAAGISLSVRNIKKHFTFTYLNFSLHMLYVFCLAGLFKDGNRIVFIPSIIFFVAVGLWYAFSQKSFYYLICAIIYGYIGFSYLFIRFILGDNMNEGAFYLLLFYFIFSSIGIIFYLRRCNRQFKLL